MSTSYRFRLDRPLGAEAVRIFDGAVRQARRALKTPDDEGIHRARKALKRSRALLRLIRFGVPLADFRALDREVRAIGRVLAPIRDAAVLLDLLDRLAPDGALKSGDLEKLRTVSEARRDAAHVAFEAQGGGAAVRDRLAAVRLAPHGLDLDTLTIHAGLEATYGRGMDRLASAVEDNTAETLHAWRRQAKYLGYQLRLLTPSWPHLLGPTARAFDALSEGLGDDHDYAEWARFTDEAALPRKVQRRVAALAEERRAALQHGVWPLGARLYAESPMAFAGRLTVYLATALAVKHGAPVHPLDGLALPAPPNRPLVVPVSLP